jgi:succinoglycan biosynthesis transport protein ExoP
MQAADSVCTLAVPGCNCVTRETVILQESSNFGYSDPLPGEDAPRPSGPEGLLMVFWRQRAVIIICALACVLAGAVYLALATRIYTSTAKMSITLSQSHLSGQSQAITDATAGNYLYTERELILSPAVLSLAAQLPEVKPHLAGQLAPIQFLQKELDVEVGKRDTIISVSFSSPDKYAASDIANGIVEAYTRYQKKPKPADLAELQRLSDERSKLDAVINDKSTAMTALEQRYGVLTGVAVQGSLAERQLTALYTEMNAAHLETLKAKAEYDEAAAAARALGNDAPSEDPADALPLSAEQATEIRTQILIYQTRLDDLKSKYLPDHPAVKMVVKKIAQLRKTYAQAVERQYRIVEQREHDLNINMEAQQKQAIEVSAAAAQYGRLQADLDNARKTEDQIDTRKREVELARDLGMLNIDPYEAAIPAIKPTQHKTITLGIALLVGLLAGSAFGFLRDWMDDRFRSIEEMRAATGLSLIGIIPKMGNGSPAIHGQQALLEPQSAVAEACRMVRTAIHFGSSKEPRRTLLITSPSSGEGKSTLASNLAITLAQTGRRVLLIDADLRLPTQHKIFGAINQSGLSTVLQGGAPLDEAVEPTEVNGLELLPAGPIAHNPAEMLNSPAFSELLDTLYDRYDHVVIDSAPVVGLADSRIIAASCDATVLVLRASVSTRRNTALAHGGLNSVGAQLVGIVVNDAEDGLQSSYPYIAPIRRPRHREDNLRSLTDSRD